jgi:Flp pilus assembly protein protease CpaA
MFVNNTYLVPLVFIWLCICTAYDLKTRQVPNALTIIPLALAGIYRLVQVDWQLMLLVIALILISDIPKPGLRIPFGLLAAVLAAGLSEVSANTLQIAVLFLVWALWEMDKLGGADAKIILALVLFFSDGCLLLPILFAGGLQGMVALILKRRQIPYTLSIAIGSMVWLAMIR